MDPAKDKLSDTGKELAAVAHDLRDEVTGAIDAAREQGRRDARHRRGEYTPKPVPESGEMIRVIAERVFDDKIRGHRLDCMEPGGGLCEVEKKVDKILEVMSEKRGEARVMAVMRATGTAVALAVLGFVLNHFAAKRTEETLAKQSTIAADVAKHLRDYQVEAAQTGAFPPVPVPVPMPMTKAAP